MTLVSFLFCLNRTSFPTFLTLQDKHKIRTLSLNIKFICTRCETGLKSSLLCLFLKLVQINLIFTDNVRKLVQMNLIFTDNVRILYIYYRIQTCNSLDEFMYERILCIVGLL